VLWVYRLNQGSHCCFFFTQIWVCSSASDGLGLIMKNPVKYVLFRIWIWEFATVNLIDLPVITVFVCNHQMKKVLMSVKLNMFSQCCTLTPVSISITEGCLRSGKVSHAVGYTAKVTWISNKRLRKQLKDLQLGELGKRSLSQMPIGGTEYWWNNVLRMNV